MEISQKTIEDFKDIQGIHGQGGNWNYDPYMLGLYNGMELALAMLEGREPQYREAPEQFMCDVETDIGKPLEVEE